MRKKASGRTESDKPAIKSERFAAPSGTKVDCRKTEYACTDKSKSPIGSLNGKERTDNSERK